MPHNPHRRVYRAQMDLHGMLSPMPSECVDRAERDFHFWHRVRSRMVLELGEIAWERECWWLYRLEGPSEEMH